MKGCCAEMLETIALMVMPSLWPASASSAFALAGVVGVARHADLSEIARRHDGAALRPHVRPDEAHEIVDVDGGGDRAADADVVERRHALVDVQQPELAGLEDVDVEARAPAGAIDPALLALAVHEIELAGGERELPAERCRTG